MLRHIIRVALLVVSLHTAQAQSTGPDSTSEESGFAVEYFMKLAEEGDAKAQYILGVKFALGEGVPKDDAKAVRWYTLAAEQGYALAQANLGWMYALGKGVPKNSITAYASLNVAAAQGVEVAMDARETME